MTKRKWNSGPPPHVGWWNASAHRSRDVWRWWNGKEWSEATTQNASARAAAYEARSKKSTRRPIEWTTYYPKNARVPRVKP